MFNTEAIQKLSPALSLCFIVIGIMLSNICYGAWGKGCYYFTRARITPYNVYLVLFSTGDNVREMIQGFELEKANQYTMSSFNFL